MKTWGSAAAGWQQQARIPVQRPNVQKGKRVLPQRDQVMGAMEAESMLGIPLDAEPRPGETEREAKVRAMAERIRSEARGPLARAPGNAASPGSTGVSNKMREEKDSQKLEAMLPIMENKVATAEDEAEKVSILAAPLAMEAMDELQELQFSAIRDTEMAVKAAMITVNSARREISLRTKEAEAMAPFVRDTAKEEVAKLRARLDEAQSKLDEHRSVRRDYELSLQAEKLFGELASRLATVEVDCEWAAMMAEPLARSADVHPEELNPSEVRETNDALRAARATLAPTLRLIAGRVAGLKGTVREKMMDLQSRAEASQALIDKAQRTVDEAESRVAAMPIVKNAAERIANVNEMLQKMRETEAPFLMGLETMPPVEAAEVLSRMDRASASAQAALAEAAKYVAIKIVEVGQLAEGAGDAARRELERLRHRIDEGMDRVRAFQAESGKRRRANIVEVVKVKIDEAEGAVLRLKEIAADLQTSDREGLVRALENAHMVELEAQNMVTAARRELQERQQDLRPLEGGYLNSPVNHHDLAKTKARISAMETELAKYRKVARKYEEQIRVSRSLVAVLDNLKEAEADITRLSSVEWSSTSAEDAEKSINVAQGNLSAATVQVEMKLQTSQGLELKELRDIFKRIQKTQASLDEVKGLAHEQSRSASKQAVKEATQVLQGAEAAVASLGNVTAAVQQVSVLELEQLHDKVCQITKLLADARNAVNAVDRSDTHSKVEFARLGLRLKGVDRKGKAATDLVSKQFDKISTEAKQKVLNSLRSAAGGDTGNLDVDKLFVDLSDGTGEVTDVQLQSFFQSGRFDLDLPQDSVKFALKHFAPCGLTRRTFSWALSTFYKVSREIALTDELEVVSAKKIRSLHVGEILEALGQQEQDDSSSSERVRCRAVRDGGVGWATVRGVSGTSDLTSTEKPFFLCTKETPLRSEETAESKAIRTLEAGELLELLDGPRDVGQGKELRVRGVTCGQEATGWLQIRDKDGRIVAKLSSAIYKCNETIAMTDISELNNCTLIRRINTGEALELLSEQEEARPKEGGMRKKFRACQDGAEGWITTTGSQGTSFVRAAPRHYMCLEATQVHESTVSKSKVLKSLMPGQAFAAFEEPKEVSGGSRLQRYRARAVSDGADGNIICNATEIHLQPWVSRHRLAKGAELTAAAFLPAEATAIGISNKVRLLEAGEVVQVSGLPLEDPLTGRLRAQCLASRDKAIGWMTVREDSNPSSMILQRVEEKDGTDESTAEQEADPDLVAMQSWRASMRAELGSKRNFPVKQEVKEDRPSKRPRQTAPGVM